jgi:hypothetical protein
MKSRNRSMIKSRSGSETIGVIAESPDTNRPDTNITTEAGTSDGTKVVSLPFWL